MSNKFLNHRSQTFLLSWFDKEHIANQIHLPHLFLLFQLKKGYNSYYLDGEPIKFQRQVITERKKPNNKLTRNSNNIIKNNLIVFLDMH